jgi:hypothetical protein
LSKIIIIRGNSGSGKTALSRALRNRIGGNTMLTSQDTVRREILKVPDAKGNASISLLIELIKYGKRNSSIIILEGILRADIYGALFESIVLNYGKSIYAYYYDLSFEETLARHETKTTNADFGEKEMKIWYREKYFVKILNEKVLTKEIYLNEVVELIYKQLN